MSTGNLPEEKQESDLRLLRPTSESRALKIWLVIVIVVLGALWFETTGESRAGYNVIITLTGQKTQCDVVVDGAKRGRFEAPDAKGVDTHTMWLKLKNGHHQIAIENQGKIIQAKDLEVSGKEYVRFDSGSPSEPN